MFHLSDPLSTQCVAHFGGNHGPGYDAFIALIWYFFNESNSAVRIIQSLIYSFFIIYFLIAIKKFIKGKSFNNSIWYCISFISIISCLA